MTLLFTADHHGFYLNENPFFPWVQEHNHVLETKSNAVLIRLSAHLNDDLDWIKQVQLAHEISSSGRYILWEIDFGLSAFQFSPDDTASFYSFSLAVEEFTKKIWPVFQNHTFGVILYRGPFQPSHCFPFFHWELAYADWSRDLPFGTTYDLYCAQILAEYLHRLVSFLPDIILPFALIDVGDIESPAKIAQLFSKERFEHIHLALKGASFAFEGLNWNAGFLEHKPNQSSIGIYLPSDDHIDANVIAELNSIMTEIKTFRMIPEEKLTEQWDGLDQLIVPKHAISTQGNRKLQGFVAAGGIIY